MAPMGALSKAPMGDAFDHGVLERAASPSFVPAGRGQHFGNSGKWLNKCISMHRATGVHHRDAFKKPFQRL